MLTLVYQLPLEDGLYNPLVVALHYLPSKMQSDSSAGPCSLHNDQQMIF